MRSEQRSSWGGLRVGFLSLVLVGTAVAHQQCLVELFLVLDEQHATSSVAQRLAERICLLFGMDATAHAAGA